MRGRRSILWLMGLLLLFPARVMAGSPWTHLRVTDGLLSPTVHCLAPLSDDGMLIGTSDGLNVWDGRRLDSAAKGNGLPQGHVTAALQAQGTLWVGTWGGGLACWGDGRWVRYRAGNSPLPGDWISALAQAPDGVWIATYGRGLALWEGGDWSGFSRTNSDLASDWLTCLLADRQGGVWVGTERAGLAHLDSQGRWRHYDLPFPAVTEVTALARVRGEIWVGTPVGLALLDPVTSGWRTLCEAEGIPHGAIRALAPEDAGGVWVGGDGGLVLWNGGQATSCPIELDRWHPSVSALAVDDSGCLWVGSNVQGVAVSKVLPLPFPRRLPVVLVHGWTVSDSDTLQDSEFWHLARWLRRDGLTSVYATGIAPEKTVHQNAQRLRDIIAAARRDGNCEQVDIIAFSMGGLNTRAYLETTLFQQDVRHAYILGTPHRGEYLWRDFLLWEYIAWNDDPSALELLPIHARLFNRTHRSSGRVPYSLIAGEAHGERLPLLFRELPPGDGLVSTWSALGLATEGVTRRLTEDIHAWSDDTILLGAPSLLYPGDSYEAHIRPGLFAQPLTSEELPVTAMHLEEPCLEPRTPLYEGQVSPGVTVTLPAIPVDAGERVRFLCRWHGAPLEMTLIDPAGRKIDDDVALDDDDVEYLSLDFADFSGYVLTNTLPGLWQVSLGADDEAREPSRFVLYVQQRTGLALSLETNGEWYRPGETVAITATVRGLAPDALVVDLIVRAYAPDREERLIHLAPTGDQTPSGEICYTGRYRPTQGGYHILMGEARGRQGDVAWARGGATVLGMSTQTAEISGSYQLALHDAGGPGICVGLNVQEAAELLLAVSFPDGRGGQTVLSHPVTLAAGEHSVTLPLRDQGEIPRHLDEIVLVDISGAGILLDEAWNVVLPEDEGKRGP